ncbi:MAG: Gfo/Idh/MocA family protein [Kiritimatiellia bacterium]
MQQNIAMIGGGLGSFMGPIHRRAIEKAGGLKITCGAFGSTRQSSYDCQEPFGLGVRDVYGTYRELLRHQGKLPPEERVAFAAAVLPNTMHYPVAMMAMDCGVPVLGEKPFTCNMDEATNLARKSRATGVPYRIAMVYPAYSMLLKARKLFRDGVLGRVRRFHVSMQLGWMAGRVELEENRQAMWRTDARRNGVGGVINDASCSCQYVLEFITGYRITDVCATARPCVPGRLIPDDATVLVHTDQGIDGVFLLSQIATGHREGLVVELTGDNGAMLWRECEPGRLVLVANDGSEKVLTDKTAPGSIGGVTTPFCAGEAYVEALARVYRDFADTRAGRTRRSRTADGNRILGMTIEEGVRTVAVCDAIIRSAAPVVAGAVPQPKWVHVEAPAL